MKVGALVRIRDGVDSHPGQIGCVEEVYTGGEFYISVRFGHEEYDRYLFGKGEFDLV